MKQKILLKTTDHWNIALFKYPNNKVNRRYPVLLLHGIACDHTIFDLGIANFSYAHYLVEQGFQVYALDLRGRGASDGPHTGRGNVWSIDDYLLCDLPAAVEYILEETSSEKLHWVGHSLGGILGFFYQIRHKAANLKSLTTFASAVTYTFSTINHFRTYLDYLSAMPYYPINLWFKSYYLILDQDNWFTRFLWSAENMTHEVKKALIEKTVHRIAILEWNQIKTISAAEGMPRLSGGFNHYVTDRRIVAPTLLLAGDRDWICPLDGVEWSRDHLKCPVKMVAFGKDYGNKTHYGHLDLICGLNAPQETWPVSLTHLVEQDSK